MGHWLRCCWLFCKLVAQKYVLVSQVHFELFHPFFGKNNFWNLSAVCVVLHPRCMWFGVSSQPEKIALLM